MGRIIRNPDKGRKVISRYLCHIIIRKRTERMKKMNSVIKVLVLSVSASLLAPRATGTSMSPSPAANAPEKGGKVLVTYFTRPETDGVDASSGASRVVRDGKLYGNTEYVAMMIAEVTGGELFAIRTEKTYPAAHQPLVDEAKREAEAKERPRLSTHIRNLDDYDVIFVGYPNWWYDMPMPIYSFFDEYDFGGKTIIPFVTHGGSRFSQSVETIRGLEKQAKVIAGPSVSSGNVGESRKIIEAWLQKQGLLSK